MNMKKTIVLVSLISAVIFMTIGLTGCYGDIDGDVRIIALDYRAVVVDEPDGRGKAVITELLTFDVRAHSRQYLIYELWRDLPEEYVDGVKVEYNVLSVRQIFRDGSSAVFEETPNLYWWDRDYISTEPGYGPGHWHHSTGPYDGYQNWECVLIYVDGLYDEVVHFEVVYERYNSSLRYNDSSVFIVTLFSEDDVRHLRSVRGQILFPNDLMPGPGNYDAFTFGTNARGFPFTESTTTNPGYHTFSFELDHSQLRFRPYNRYIEFELIAHGDDRHIFTQYAQKNNYYDTDVLTEIWQELADYEALPGMFRLIKVIVLLSLAALVALTFYIILANDRRLRGKYGFHDPVRPDELYRDIPSELDPCFAAAFVFTKHRKPDYFRDGYAAVMLSLAKKGYIELKQVIRSNTNWAPENINILFMHTPTQGQSTDSNNPDSPTDEPATQIPLTKTEELFFNLILRHAKGRGNRLRLSELGDIMAEDYDYTNTFVYNVKNAVKAMGAQLKYYLKADYNEIQRNANAGVVVLVIVGALTMLIGNLVSYQTRLGLAFGAFFILGAGFIAAAIYLSKLSGDYILFTKSGAAEYAKWRGLYNFLSSDELVNERTILDLPIWGSYLVYGTAFGISKNVIKALEIRCPSEHMYMNSLLHNPYFRTNNFRSYGHHFRTATRRASFNLHSHGSGGSGWSSSGWGGSGGGRGGGGGGGGGH